MKRLLFPILVAFIIGGCATVGNAPASEEEKIVLFKEQIKMTRMAAIFPFPPKAHSAPNENLFP